MTVEYLKSCKEKPTHLRHVVMGTIRPVIMYHEVHGGRWGFSYPGDLGIVYIDQWEPASEREYMDYLSTKS